MSGTLIDFCKQLEPTPLKFPEALLQAAKDGIEFQHHFPTTRDEAWKYTRLGRVAALKLNAIKINQTSQPLSGSDYVDIIFENETWYCAETIPGLHISFSGAIDAASWNACSLQGHVQHINALTAQGGIVIHVDAHTQLAQPIRIIHRINGDKSALILHHQLVLGNQASARLEVFFEGTSEDSYANVLFDFFLGEGASLHTDMLQEPKGVHYGFHTQRVYQQKDSTFALQTLTANTHFTRNEVEVFSQAEGTHTQLYGAFIGRENNHIDNHTYVHHMAPNCTSDENYKGVLSDKATGVFNGKVKVYQDAQKINAYQSNKNILLSEAASINAKPELEIYADDVKCSHGSTTGQLDQQALFFLRARGISEAKATDMLIKGFMAEIVGGVKSSHIQEALHTLLD
ncbi:MAG: Fe-S cluster assembly protein SufD [Flavobacteriales bacterium]